MNRQRRKSVIARIIDPGAQSLQRIDQITDRPLMHARDAIDAVFTTAKCQGSGQRAYRSAGIAQEQFGFFHRKGAVDPINFYGVLSSRLMLYAQRSQCRKHVTGVIGFQHFAQRSLALRQCGQQQHAIGDAFGTRQQYRAAHCADRLQVEIFEALGAHQGRLIYA